MMKYTITAAVAATFTASAALAGGAIQPIMEAEPQAVYVAPAAGGWTGGYLGGNLNYGKGKLKPGSYDGQSGPVLARSLDPELGYNLGRSNFAPDGASAALRAGYDWQRGAGVFGIGAEYNFGKYKDSINVSEDFTVNADIKNAATIFARAGYAFNDNFMAYGLLGYTWAKLDVSSNAFPSASESLGGGTIGLGGEYKLNSNWSTYAEYTYTDFGKVKNTDGLLKATLGQAKLGVNYRF